MKYPISACRKLRKVVVKSGDLLDEAILGVLPQQYLCTIKQSARRGGRLKGEYSKNYNGLLVGKTDLTFEWCYKRHKWLYKWKNCVHNFSRLHLPLCGRIKTVHRYGNQRAAVAGYIKATCYIVYRNKWLTKRTKQIMQSYAYGFAVRFSVQVV